MKANRFRFRAWDTECKKMRDLDQWSVSAMTNDPSIIPMQSTGLTDSAGKEIFEGDVVRWYDFDKHDFWYKEIEGSASNGFNDYENRDVVELRIPHYWLKHEKFGYEGEELIDIDTDGLIVIGNIWENPELVAK